MLQFYVHFFQYLPWATRKTNLVRFFHNALQLYKNNAKKVINCFLYSIKNIEQMEDLQIVGYKEH